MSDANYLKRMFRAYYEENSNDIPIVSEFNQREFGFIPWNPQIMIRHIGFTSPEILRKYLIDKAPRHAYCSGSVYESPEIQDMKQKGYHKCDFIIDIDVDHFYTPCKDDHDIWICKECGKSGKGMIKKCPKCKKSKIDTLTWICDECLRVAKQEIIKLIDDFLIPDFGIIIEDMKIAFSGHRGYHIKITEEKIRHLSSEARRELVDYITGENISLEVLGLKKRGNKIYGLSNQAFGWPKKILKGLENLLMKPKDEIRTFLEREPINFGPNLIDSFIKGKEDFLYVLRDSDHNIWAIEGFALTRWKQLLKGVVHEIGAEIDEPVSIDIHRLIRYPGTLHGKTGFKVQELTFDELIDYEPLHESRTKLDPIVFSGTATHKLEITADKVPQTHIKAESFGPYEKGDKIDVPHHIAIFLISKGVAKIIKL